MCKASNVIGEFKRLSKDVENEQKKLLQMLSRCDKEVSALYHKLEVSIFNKRQGDAYSRKLQSLMKRRRIIKQEIDRFKSIAQTMNLSGMYANANKAQHNVDKLKNKHKSYTYGWGIAIEDIEREFSTR